MLHLRRDRLVLELLHPVHQGGRRLGEGDGHGRPALARERELALDHGQGLDEVLAPEHGVVDPHEDVARLDLARPLRGEHLVVGASGEGVDHDELRHRQAGLHLHAHGGQSVELHFDEPLSLARPQLDVHAAELVDPLLDGGVGRGGPLRDQLLPLPVIPLEEPVAEAGPPAQMPIVFDELQRPRLRRLVLLPASRTNFRFQLCFLGK
mmetsp:Transcript_34219/g.77304  ORF Transcript_34219/g.77304 Transcript_34219/m.77304 type:complete len:208 (-) Transcript_34219:721-1344(-)